RVGEASEEAGPRDSAGRTAADIGHVGEVAFEHVLVLVPERQSPGPVARIDTTLEQFGAESVVVGEEAAGDRAESDHAGAGQGGDVDHTGRLEAFGVG